MNLKPCPNCGEQAFVAIDPGDGDRHINYVGCYFCPLGVEDRRLSNEQLIEIWDNLPRRGE